MGEEYVEKDLSDEEVVEGLLSEDLDTRTAAFNQVGKLPVAEKKKDAKSVLAVDAKSGQTLWTKSDKDAANLLPSTLCVGIGQVLFQSPIPLRHALPGGAYR